MFDEQPGNELVSAVTWLAKFVAEVVDLVERERFDRGRHAAPCSGDARSFVGFASLGKAIIPPRQ